MEVAQNPENLLMRTEVMNMRKFRPQLEANQAPLAPFLLQTNSEKFKQKMSIKK